MNPKPRKKLFEDLGNDFRDENQNAEMYKAVEKNREYQVDPLDMDEKNPYEKFKEENEYEDVLMHSPTKYLSEDELNDKVDLYINDPLEYQEPLPLPPPPPSPSELMEYGSPEQIEASQAEHYGPRYSTPNLSKPTPASKNNPYGVPNATFEIGGYRHEYYNDGRRVKTKIKKPRNTG